MGLVSIALIFYGIYDLILYAIKTQGLQGIPLLNKIENTDEYKSMMNNVGRSSMELGVIKILVGVMGGEMCALLMFVATAGTGIVSLGLSQLDNVPPDYKTYVYVGLAVVVSLFGLFG